MLPYNYINVYCHKCGKICSSLIKPKPLKECEEFIQSWLKCPYCIDCILKKMKRRLKKVNKK